MLNKLDEAKHFFLSRCTVFPETVIVMGSGMSDVLSDMEVEEEFSFKDIPHVPQVSVQGHKGKIKIGRVGGKRVVVSQGRLHFYEGLPMSTVVLPFRAMALAGAKNFILTNAAGGMHAEMTPPSLVLISDHINLMGTNPLIGPNLEDLGPRFPDLTHLYDPDIRAAFRAAAKKVQVPLREGVYLGIHGPSYETPAEIRMYRQLGADVVGMSTVPEAIALRHMGRRVAGISCVTNLAAGVTGEPMNHQEVLDNAKTAQDSLGRLLTEGIRTMGGAP